MRVGILTSSRADYGIYRPLLKRLEDNPIFDLAIMAFGTHLSDRHGYTLRDIRNDGFDVDYEIQTLAEGDSEETISKMMALTATKFTPVWRSEKEQLDLVFCLGDRYEMFSAVSAAVPFNIPFGHIHGGETTLGAIDNTFRHCLTLMSDYHFTSHPAYTKRVASIQGNKKNIYTVGALGLDNMKTINLLSIETFKEEFKIDLSRPTILFTFHPETVNPERNEEHIQEIISALQNAERYQILITGTNTDTHNLLIRKALSSFSKQSSRIVKIIENMGTRGYFSAMKHCSFLMGNTSSGIIEAASLGARVINLGDRQKGRMAGSNVVTVAVQRDQITSKIQEIEKISTPVTENIYWHGGAAGKIIQILKEHFDK